MAPLANVQITLRVLATTDLHMNVLGFDYGQDRPGKRTGLAGLAQTITDLRADLPDAPCLLLDNDDFLQGNPLADWLADNDITEDHPLFLAFNEMGYDAIGLGNHDLDYRQSYLARIIAALDAAVLSTNLSASAIIGLQRTAMITRHIETEGGALPLSIGLVSALPPETSIWNRSTLLKGAVLHNPIECLRHTAKDLRKNGADIVIALAHMGMGHGSLSNRMADTGAALLSQISDLDMIVAGHTHHTYSDPSAKIDAAPHDTAVPIVMPGAYGSHLGVVDLGLVHSPQGGWDVASKNSRLLPAASARPQSPAIQRVHNRARAALAEPVAQIKEPLHNHFVLLQPCRLMALTARAKASAIRNALKGSQYSNLPLLAAAAARTAEGDGSIDIPAGPFRRRHLSVLAPYNNQICALVLTGAQLRGWLEVSAAVYQAPNTASPAQLLRDDLPGYQFDAIYGLTYAINPGAPVGGRITGLSFAGAPLAEDQSFVLATNSFRAAGGGGYEALNLAAPVAISPVSMSQSIAQVLQNDDFVVWNSTNPWRLTAPGRTALVDLSETALAYLDDIASLRPRIKGPALSGRVQVKISL